MKYEKQYKNEILKFLLLTDIATIHMNHNNYYSEQKRNL